MVYHYHLFFFVSVRLFPTHLNIPPKFLRPRPYNIEWFYAYHTDFKLAKIQDLFLAEERES